MSYFLDDIATLHEKNALTEDEKAFNQTILYGNDVSMTTVTDTARRFPMMSQRQVVIVKEAQNIRDFENLLPYIDHLQPTTILVFLYKNKKPDKRKGVFKKLSSYRIASISSRPNFTTTRSRTGLSRTAKTRST